MSDGRKPKLKDAAEDVRLPNMKLDVQSEANGTPHGPLSPEQSYLKRKAEVTQQDNEDFSQYLQQKSARDQQQEVQSADPPQKAPAKVNRRTLLTWAACTAAVGAAGTPG